VAGLLALAAFTLPKRVSAQTQSASLPVYFPCPPGLIPSGLQMETGRAKGEVAALEQEAFKRWRASASESPNSSCSYFLLVQTPAFSKQLYRAISSANHVSARKPAWNTVVLGVLFA
jgi:hypothetical protein